MSRKISQFTEIMQLDGATDYLPVVVSGENRKVTVNNLLASGSSSGPSGGATIAGIMMRNYIMTDESFVLAWDTADFWSIPPDPFSDYTSHAQSLAISGWEPSIGNNHQLLCDFSMVGLEGGFKIVFQSNSLGLLDSIPGSLFIQLSSDYFNEDSPYDVVNHPRTEIEVVDLDNVELPGPITSINKYINIMFQFDDPNDKPANAYAFAVDDPDRLALPFSFIENTNIFVLREPFLEYQ